AFLQAAEAFGRDRRIVHEHVGAAVFGSDEAETLGVVEPLHCAVLHDSFYLVWMRLRMPTCKGPGTHCPSMQRLRAACNHPTSMAPTRAGSFAEAAATLASTSSRVMISSV